MLEQGMLVEGKYRILSEIGRGGMSIVYLAIVESANMTWAVKEVRKDGSNDYNVVRQGLIAEIDTLKSVKHSKLPRIVDVIEHEDSYIIVMDYIEGRSMDKVLREKGAQSEENVVKWALQLCEVLGYLHSRPKPLIYRDMKPSNIMLKPNGDITIVDFGTVKKYEVSSGETTGLGTEGYAAPEQHGGLGRTDARTDIFALGMTMYALLTGIDPQEKLVIDTSIRKVNPALSEGLDEIVLKCTQREAELRYKSCAELSYALEHYLDSDKKNRKKKKTKITVFASTLLLSVLLGAGSLVMNISAKSMASDNYDEIIQKAVTADYDEKLKLYEEAINIPDKNGEKNAYLELINTYKSNDGENIIFTEDEAKQLRELINMNISALESNPEGYSEICYETGKLFWYYYSDTNHATRAKNSVDWFKKVKNMVDDGRVTKTFSKESLDYKLADAYSAIGSFYDEYPTRVIEGNDRGMYKPLFENMKELVDNIAGDDDASAIVRLEILEWANNILYQYASQYRQDDVSREDAENFYEEILDKTNDVPELSDTLNVKKADIISTAKDTKAAIEAAYSKSGGGEQIS